MSSYNKYTYMLYGEIASICRSINSNIHIYIYISNIQSRNSQVGFLIFEGEFFLIIGIINIYMEKLIIYRRITKVRPHSDFAIHFYYNSNSLFLVISRDAPDDNCNYTFFITIVKLINLLKKHYLLQL